MPGKDKCVLVHGEVHSVVTLGSLQKSHNFAPVTRKFGAGETERESLPPYLARLPWFVSFTFKNLIPFGPEDNMPNNDASLVEVMGRSGSNQNFEMLTSLDFPNGFLRKQPNRTNEN